MPPTPLRDIVVVLPGITGSVLARTRGAGRAVDIWAVSGQALYESIRTLGGAVGELELPAHDPTAEDPPQTVISATRVIPNFHGILGLGRVDGYTALREMIAAGFRLEPGTLGAEPANFFEFPYDWRLSNRHSARALRDFLEPRLRAWRQSSQGAPDAKVILLVHSMGGLVSRYYLEVLEGWKDCRALISFGTPYRGSINAASFIANGYRKLLLDLTAVLRSCPSVYELLPVYPAFRADGQWKRAAEVALPNANANYVHAAATFHKEIREAVERHEREADYLKNRYRIVPFVGVAQPTHQSVWFVDEGGVEARPDRPAVIDESLDGGDGTVPRASATPLEMSSEFRETFFAERHASLQNNEHALDDLCERIRQMQSPHLGEVRSAWRPGERPMIGLELEELYMPDEPVTLDATVSGGPCAGLLAQVQPLTGGPPLETRFRESETGWSVTLDGLAAGPYRVKVRSATGGENIPAPVRDVFEVASA